MVKVVNFIILLFFVFFSSPSSLNQLLLIFFAFAFAFTLCGSIFAIERTKKRNHTFFFCVLVCRRTLYRYSNKILKAVYRVRWTGNEQQKKKCQTIELLFSFTIAFCGDSRLNISLAFYFFCCFVCYSCCCSISSRFR